ncbi:hypothetical protein JHK87_006421 [Glycine soja]|nr:hypothetical protein JHK87_006421 [Glycine soja]
MESLEPDVADCLDGCTTGCVQNDCFKHGVKASAALDTVQVAEDSFFVRHGVAWWFLNFLEFDMNVIGDPEFDAANLTMLLCSKFQAEGVSEAAKFPS